MKPAPVSVAKLKNDGRFENVQLLDLRKGDAFVLTLSNGLRLGDLLVAEGDAFINPDNNVATIVSKPTNR
jgi:hypothetical protein